MRYRKTKIEELSLRITDFVKQFVYISIDKYFLSWIMNSIPEYNKGNSLKMSPKILPRNLTSF